MEFNEAKERLKSLFTEKDFTLVDEHMRELYFRHSVRATGLVLEEEDISSFSRLVEIENEPFPCSIRDVDYVEVLLTETGRRLSSRFLFGDEGGIDFIGQSPDSAHLRIGYASHVFLNFFLQHEAFNLLFFLRPVYIGSGFQKMSELRQRFTTARVWNLASSSPQQAYNRAFPLINACLFTLAYMRQVSFQISEDWPQRAPARRPFRYTDRLRRGEVPIPQVRYDENLVRLYQRGVGSADPVVQYLSFYQVLEYHFITVSDSELFKRLGTIIGDPAFRPTAKYLGRLVHQTLAHRRETDETEMLKLVLREFVDERELEEFVERYEEYLAEKIFSRSHHMFGVDVKLTMQTGHIVGSVARRVKHIRNALVHAADRFEGFERYIPSRSNEQKLEKEVPLVRFLAEKAIIGSGSG
jgi:hypothetical protein